ncbi:hypothetical protein ACFL6I_12655, partial [candidate division KSB1 bacterium]
RQYNSGKKVRLQVEAIAEIELKEQELLQSIESLTQLANAKMEWIDQDLYMLYKARLDIIDELILSCLEAIRENEYNINARKYLFLAYEDKISTLKKIVEIES